MKKVIIVGGVAGGMSAATRLRRLKEDWQITIYEKGPFVSFANCGLPYYVSGEIAERASLVVQTPQALKSRFNLDIFTEHEVIAIDGLHKKVRVKSPLGEREDTYDYLILSPGAKPIVPMIKKIEQAKNTFTLRNIPDLDRIMAHLDGTSIKNVTVVGAGFIGIEMAENLAARGYQVTIVEKAPHVLPPLDEEMAKFIENELRKNGVKVLVNQSVVEMQDQGKTLLTEDGQIFASDLTLLAIGVQPESDLAKAAGIKTGLREGIIVDDYYETSVKDIYAVGDAILVNHQVTNQAALVPLASPANRQGRQVADNLSGRKRKNRGSIGTAIVRAFHLTAASTGINERLAKQLNLPYKVVHLTGKDHAGYYPGASEVHLKLIFNGQTGEIYGAQAVGEKGIDKRMDVIATAIKGGLTVEDLPEIELTYAPPFGSAKDVVNMAGYASLNILEGDSVNVQWWQLEEELAKGSLLLDVRQEAELKEKGRFKNAIHIPLDQLRDRMNELDSKQEYIITCHSGLRSYIGERLLKQNGFSVRNLDGAFGLYQLIKPEEIIHD